jgi:glutamyl-tRNA reductase
MGELVLVGVSHRTAGIELRERVALSPMQATAMLGDLVAEPPVREALVLSTCSRTELYALVSGAGAAETVLLGALARHAGLEPEALAAGAQIARGFDALEHLFRVAAGLESMVLGEVEILGQLRRARGLASSAGATSHSMRRVVDRALVAGRLARERTSIGAGRASVSSVATGRACRFVGDAGGHALVIGSGDTGAMTARALRAAGMDVTIVAGRRSERADALAAEVGGRAVPIEGGLREALAAADVVVSCTASPHPLVPFELLAEVMERRAGRALMLLDLAMPRDVDPAVRALPGVQLHDLDDLTQTAAATANGRAAAVPDAAALVTAEADLCARWMAGLGMVSTIKRLRRKTHDAVLEGLRRSELSVGVDEHQLRAVSEAIVSRLLHHPTLQLKAAAALGEGDDLAASVGQLFELG